MRDEKRVTERALMLSRSRWTRTITPVTTTGHGSNSENEMGLWYLQETVADPPLEKARAIELDRSGEMEQRLVIRTKVSEMFHKSAEQDSFVYGVTKTSDHSTTILSCSGSRM